MFGEDKKPSWLLLSASLLMITWSPMTDMMSMGIILENGYSSLWVLKDRFWLAGAPAILFASMWAGLKFKTDNELLRLRYSGSSAVVMHVFRALFLSLFVIPFFGTFIILALRKFLDVLFAGQHLPINTILTVGVMLIVLKNSFRQKIRTDGLNAIICIIAPVIICFFIFQQYGGFSELYSLLRTEFPNKTNLLPSFEPVNGKSTLSNFLVFIFIQWWSVYIIDNSDPSAQRHLQAKSRFLAFKALFLPILISSVMFLLISVIWDCGILEYKNFDPNLVDPEAFYIEVALKYLPAGFKAIVAIAFLFSFVTTLENIINWGGGLLTVDIIKRYLYTGGSDRQYRYLSFMTMLLVSSISLIFAFNSEKLFNLQKFIFSISAGVAPVFLLRWFWWRINAWTQISAMASSLIYTLMFDYLYSVHVGFKSLIDSFCHAALLDYYPLKLIILTTAVVITWLTTMYCTEPVAKEQLRVFYKTTGTGGIWPKEFGDNRYQLSKKVILCLVFAATYILPYLFVWQVKFGSPSLACLLLLLFILLATMVYRFMAILLKGQPVIE
jgi:Na+/proline symporter